MKYMTLSSGSLNINKKSHLHSIRASLPNNRQRRPPYAQDNLNYLFAQILMLNNLYQLNFPYITSILYLNFELCNIHGLDPWELKLYSANIKLLYFFHKYFSSCSAQFLWKKNHKFPCPHLVFFFLIWSHIFKTSLGYVPQELIGPQFVNLDIFRIISRCKQILLVNVFLIYCLQI